MKFLAISKDGGKQSNVTGFWLVEIKSLFSIVFLRFGKGSREAFHSHAFNALTWFLWGNVTEHHVDGRALNWRGSLIPKFTPRSCFHKVYAHENTYAFSIRGPWANTWQEYLPKTDEFVTLTHGRLRVTEGK
jgi:hypothetical protein